MGLNACEACEFDKRRIASLYATCPALLTVHLAALHHAEARSCWRTARAAALRLHLHRPRQPRPQGTRTGVPAGAPERPPTDPPIGAAGTMWPQAAASECPAGMHV
jgi:hypothetical protein